MPEYAEKFKRLLMEEIDISRNRDDAHIDPDVVSPDEFDVDPMSANVGFQSLNTERDTEILTDILMKIEKMTESLPALSKKISSVSRTFGEDLIDGVKKKLADVNKELGNIVLDIKNTTDINPPKPEENEEVEGDY
jgi:hypothetical protein